MAKYVIDGPKRGAPKEPAPSIESDYYQGDVLSEQPKTDYEAKGKELLESGEKQVKEARTWAEKKFGDFFSSMRTKVENMAKGAAKVLNIGVGRGAEAMSTAGRVVVEAAKVPGYIAKGGFEAGKFVAGEAAEVLEATGEILGTGVGKTVEAGIAGAKYLKDNKEAIRDKVQQAAKDAVMYDDLKEMGGNLVEAAKWAASPESGEAIIGAAGSMKKGLREVGRMGADLGRGTVRGVDQGYGAIDKAIDSVIATGKLKFADAKAFVSRADQAVRDEASGLARGVHEEFTARKHEGIASASAAYNEVKRDLAQMKTEASEAAEAGYATVEQNLERGERRMNELYDRGVDTYAEYNGRISNAKSAWDNFRNAGRQALEAFSSIFGGKSNEKKKLAQDIVAAIDAQKQLDAAPKAPVIKQIRGSRGA